MAAPFPDSACALRFLLARFHETLFNSTARIWMARLVTRCGAGDLHFDSAIPFTT